MTPGEKWARSSSTWARISALRKASGAAAPTGSGAWSTARATAVADGRGGWGGARSGPEGGAGVAVEAVGAGCEQAARIRAAPAGNSGANFMLDLGVTPRVVGGR
jgi:hypothetical protein